MPIELPLNQPALIILSSQVVKAKPARPSEAGLGALIFMMNSSCKQKWTSIARLSLRRAPHNGHIAIERQTAQIESANWEITAGFSTVDVSCEIASPFATERNRRRTTLPERVLGIASPKRMSFGFAIGPI